LLNGEATRKPDEIKWMRFFVKLSLLQTPKPNQRTTRTTMKIVVKKMAQKRKVKSPPKAHQMLFLCQTHAINNTNRLSQRDTGLRVLLVKPRMEPHLERIV
jgi:hypothetical protein